jgi:hypothetical protein
VRSSPPAGPGSAAFRVDCRLAVALLAAAILLGPAGGRAAEGGAAVEIAPYAGLLWSTQVQTRAGPISTSLAADLGATLGFRLEPDRGPGPERTGQVELLYVFAEPAATFRPTSASAPALAPFHVRYQYFQVGGLAGFPQEGFEPFASASVGAAWLSATGVTLADGTPVEVGDTWAFAVTLGGGVRWFLSSALGLRLGARLMLPIFFQSAAFFSGPMGASLVVSSGVPQVQGDFTLALIIAP